MVVLYVATLTTDHLSYKAMILENFSCINVLNVPLTRGHPEENGFPNIPIDDSMKKEEIRLNQFYQFETGGNSPKSIISNWMNKSFHSSNEACIFSIILCVKLSECYLNPF